MELSITPASKLAFEDVLAAFNAGYEGYLVPVNLNIEQFQTHLVNNDIDLDASCVAKAGTEVVGVVLLGRRDSRAWVGGIGVIPAYRNHGVGRRLMEALLDAARASKLASVQLEVIVGNDNAYHLYQKIGFQTLRRLLILERAPAPTTENHLQVETISPVEALSHYERLHTVPNAWQRERESLLKSADKMSGWVVTHNGQVSAYGVGIIQSENIRWFDLAASDRDALYGLLTHVHRQHSHATAHLVNLGEDDPVWSALSPLGYREVMSQWEMQLAL
jgi:ribosomal protein S18 acetylase RimI-like enzyme